MIPAVFFDPFFDFMIVLLAAVLIALGLENAAHTRGPK